MRFSIDWYLDLISNSLTVSYFDLSTSIFFNFHDWCSCVSNTNAGMRKLFHSLSTLTPAQCLFSASCLLFKKKKYFCYYYSNLHVYETYEKKISYLKCVFILEGEKNSHWHDCEFWYKRVETDFVTGK